MQPGGGTDIEEDQHFLIRLNGPEVAATIVANAWCEVEGGRPLGAGERLRWAPWPGRHRLELVGAGGQTLQSVAFEVRGAGVKSRAGASR